MLYAPSRSGWLLVSEDKGRDAVGGGEIDRVGPAVGVNLEATLQKSSKLSILQ